MKICNTLLIVWLLFFSTGLNAQQDERYLLQLSTGTVALPANYEQQKKAAIQKSDYFQGYYYRYLQVKQLPNAEERENLKRSGIQLLMYLPSNTYVAAIKKGSDLSASALALVRGIHPVKAEYKMLKELADALKDDNFPHYTTRGNKVGIGFTYYETIEHEVLKKHLRAQGYHISFEDKGSRWFVVWVKKSKIKKFVALPFVNSAELVDDEAKPENNVGRTDIRSNSIATDYSGGRKFNGTGVDIALQDDGIIGPHIDYQGRLPNQFLSSNSGDHGDHCGGIIMGAGNKDPLMRGMAWGADLHVYSASNYQAFTQITTHYNTLGIRIISTSYSDGCNAGYTTRAQQLDIQNLAMPELIHVFSAGNDGASNCNYGAGAGWGNVTGGHKHSKNSIAVANLSYLDVRNTSSSRGPAHDGRLKPEVSAVGTNVISTSDTNRYVTKTGTSMSCPAVAGVFGQLYQAYKTLNNNANPSSALMKAIVMNTADDLGNPGPDFGYGYGRVNALKAVKVLEQGAYLTGTVTNAASNSHAITIPAGVRRVKVMTYWHDYQAQVGAAIALVNDLNTTLTDPGLTSYNPLVLNFSANATSLNSNAAPGIDNRNNHEQITLLSPAAGVYTLTVSGFNVPMGPQAYVVTWIFEMDGYTVTYPIGGEGFSNGTLETVRWDTEETSGVQTLEYTADNGASWSLISNNIPGAQRYFNWSPPNVISGQCKVRISRGAYSAESDTVFSIIPVPANLNVAWVCPDSVKIQWNTVVGATGYDVFRLGTMYMDSIATTSNTSVVVTNVPINQTSWFSVRARGPLGAVGRRAIAIEKKPGVLACPQVAFDVACNQVKSPAGTSTDCYNHANTKVIVSIDNPGINTLTLVNVYYSINNGPVITEVYNGVISPSASLQYTFTTTANLASAGSYSIKAWAKNSADIILTNDTATSLFIVAPSLLRNLPLSEDFENFSLCSTNGYCQQTCNLIAGFVNETNDVMDQMDWRTNSGAVPTASTGPKVDFTNGSSTGKYVYVESSVPCAPLFGNMLSPCLNLPSAANPSVSFAYHMYGATMGTLSLDIYARGSWTNAIWSLSGDQGDSWQVALVDLSAWANDTVTLRWRANTASGSLSDMAIDGINVYGSTSTGIKDAQGGGLVFSVYPNPGTGLYTITLPQSPAGNIDYAVYDLTGRELLQESMRLKEGNNHLQLDLSNYAAGVYTMRIQLQGHTTNYKLHKL